MQRMVPILIVVATVVSTPVATPGQERPRPSRRTPVVEVFEQTRDAVVNISTTRIVQVRSLHFPSLWDDIFDFGPPRPRDRRVQSVGSGVVVHERGYIVTNAHVVSQASDVQVIFADGKTIDAAIVAVDPEHDLAVLQVDVPKPLKAVQLGRSDDLMIGETVVAIGNPLGLQHTVTAGIVSALNRDLRFKPDVVYTGLIQTDTPINPGNSGGPLLNVNAELIGINTAIRGDAQNIGFAIPVDRLWSLLPVMLDIERRERVRFGLEVSGPEAKVIAVRPNSPAEKAGLKRGDRVMRFNNEPLRNGIDYYVHLLGQRAGKHVRLGVQRGEKTIQTEVELQAIPPPEGRPLARKLLGLELEPVPAQMRRELELPAHVGLIVADVVPGGPADEKGIRAADLILRLDGVTVATLDDVGLTLERVKPPERVVVEGLRLRADRPFYWTAPLDTRGG